MKKNKTFPILIIALAVTLAVYLIITLWQTFASSEAYIASNIPTAKVYSLNDAGDVEAAGTITRGEKVERQRKTITYSVTNDNDDDTSESDASDEIKLTLANINTDDGESLYIDEKNLVEDEGSCVLESEVYARTPATVYSDAEGPGIVSYAPKGTRLNVTGYDYVDADGVVNKYEVAFTDATEEEIQGYVYGKYMVADEEIALANYNENGEYDKAVSDVYGMELYGGKAASLDYYPYEKTEIEGNEFCNNARTMYLNISAAVNYEKYIKFIKTTGCNAVVIDIKDGPLAYKSEVAKELSPTSYKKAYTSVEKFNEAVEAYRESGLYVIGRIVVFNDSYYAKDHPEDCIKYKGDSSWPSGFSRDVWEYNVRLAQEAVTEFGFNEIQFDYVRFPESSYDMSKSGKANFRSNYKEEKGQAIQNFCFYAADQLREVGAYISVDVFGESAYGYMTAYGQYWAGISNIVDAISAMPYTDHFAGESPWTEPYKSVRRWAKQAAKQQAMLQNPAAARTWITGYDTPYWNPTVTYGEKQLKQQINALEKSGLDGGFIPWNVLSDLSKYKSYKEIWDE